MAQVAYLENEAIKIARDMVKNVTHVHVSGYNNNATNGDTVWTMGTAYPWSSLTTAQTLYIKSATNNATDRSLEVTITGLDASFNILSETIHLNSNNSTLAVSTTNQFIRVNDIYCSNANTNESEISARITSGGGTVIDNILAGHGRNMTGIYTIPNGYTGYLLKGNFSTTGSSVVAFYARPFGGTFTLEHIASADNTTYEYEFSIPRVVPEKSDLDVRLDTGAGKCSCNFEMILVKNPV